MTKDEILKELNKGKTYKEIGRIAENLLYKLCPLKRNDIREGMFNLLNREEFEKLGYDVYEVGSGDAKKLENKLKQNGFLYTHKVFFSPEKKEIWSVGYYPPSAFVCVDDTFLNPKDFINLPKLISKEQYAELIADKIMKDLESWNKVKDYFNSLVKEEKEFYGDELNEEKKEKIIEETLGKARKEGLISE